MKNKNEVLSVSGVSKSFRIQHGIERSQILHTNTRTFSDFFKSRILKKKFEYETFWALNNINLSISKGESVALIGKNGSGKSTLLKLISRIMYPDSGSISVKGRVSSLLEVGTGFHPELTGAENIFLNGAILGMSRSDVKKYYDQILTFSEIHDFIDVPVKRYSSGMYLRLAFSIAIHLTSEILLLDEVFAVGDASFQNKCQDKIREFLKKDKTIIFVSHNLQSLKDFCDYGYILNSGKISKKYDINKALEIYKEIT